MNDNPEKFWTKQYRGKRPLAFLILFLGVPGFVGAMACWAMVDMPVYARPMALLVFGIILLLTILSLWTAKPGPEDDQRSFWWHAWNDPRRFFLWLMAFSLAGMAAELLMNSLSRNQHPSDGMQKAALISAAILMASFLLGFVCMVLSWISPVRRLLAWLLQRRFYVLACLITLVALFYAEENWRGKRAWDNYRREWEAKGERFDFESVVPPPVPDDQNFAMAPIVASCYAYILDGKGNVFRPSKTNVVDRLNFTIYHTPNGSVTNLKAGSWQKQVFGDLKPWQEYYRNPPPGKTGEPITNAFPTSPEPQTPAADVLLALSKYDAAIEELREAAKRPYSRFPLNYDTDQPFAILLPHLAKAKQVANALQLRAVAELQSGQPDRALADLRLAWRFNDSLCAEPFLIDHLVRIAVQHILMQPTWEGLAERKWSAAQIAELQKPMAQHDYLADYQQTMRGELAASVATIEYVRRTRRLYEITGTESESALFRLMGRMGLVLMPNGWFYSTELAFVQAHKRWFAPGIDVSKRVSWSQAEAQQAKKEFERQVADRSVKNMMVRLLLPALENARKKFVVAQAHSDMAVLACALERYRLAHGEFPEKLEELVPGFVVSVPHDVIGGGPLHYQRTEDGLFVLYSIGWNETDDGGTVAVKEKSGSLDLENGDWVWKYPGK